MSEDLSTNTWRTSARRAFVVALLLLAGLWIASASAVLVMYWAQWIGGAPLEWLADKGWPRVMRRAAMFWGVVFLAVFLRRMGWRGWRDCGFTTEEPGWSRRRWWSLAGAGAVFGVVTLGGIAVLNMALGLRNPVPADETGIALANMVAGFIISGIAVSLVEETICRGILFRLAARAWSPWTAAVATSVLFALAHFVDAEPEAFQAETFLAAGTGVFISILVTLPSEPGFWMRFMNLTLLGLVLCAFVIRTKTVWFGIGAHAAWVWVIKLNSRLTDVDGTSGLIRWFGGRADFMDSVAATAVLAAMAGLTLRRAGSRGVPVRRRRLLWHVSPAAVGEFTAWIDSRFTANSEPGCDAEPGAAPAGGRRILKEYEGCRVSAVGGLVLKEYWPKPGWKGLRFAAAPSRARRSFVLSRKLLALGIPTAEPVAWAVRRRLLFNRAACNATREISGAERLTDWLTKHLSNPAAGTEVMKSYGRLMAMFHANAYSNRDFKHENVLCSSKSPSELRVVDLDGVARKLLVTRRRARKDLMRVGSSLAELGWNREPYVRAFFDGYNAAVPPRLEMRGFPR